MQKIVINRCFGGFGLSQEALIELSNLDEKDNNPNKKKKVEENLNLASIFNRRQNILYYNKNQKDQ